MTSQNMKGGQRNKGFYGYAVAFTCHVCVFGCVSTRVLMCAQACECTSRGTEQTLTPLISERLKGWRGNPRTSQAQRGNCLEP